jgi:hypothetical protein
MKMRPLASLGVVGLISIAAGWRSASAAGTGDPAPVSSAGAASASTPDTSVDAGFRKGAGTYDTYDGNEEDCTKTIFVDLGNQPFRGPEANGRLDAEPLAATLATSAGGNLPAGTVAIGCLTAKGFQPKKIYENESVRVVLLNPREDMDYALLQQNGSIVNGTANSPVTPNSSPLDQAVNQCQAPNDEDCEVADKELSLEVAGLRTRLDGLVQDAVDGGTPLESLGALRGGIRCDAHDWLTHEQCARIDAVSSSMGGVESDGGSGASSADDLDAGVVAADAAAAAAKAKWDAAQSLTTLAANNAKKPAAKTTNAAAKALADKAASDAKADYEVADARAKAAHAAQAGAEVDRAAAALAQARAVAAGKAANAKDKPAADPDVANKMATLKAAEQKQTAAESEAAAAAKLDAAAAAKKKLDATTEANAPFYAAVQQLAGRAAYVDRYRQSLCQDWEKRLVDYSGKLDLERNDGTNPSHPNISERVDRFSNRLYYHFTNYQSVEELLWLVHQSRVWFLDEIYGGVELDKPGDFKFGKKLSEMRSYFYFLQTWRHWCALDSKDPAAVNDRFALADGASFDVSSSLFALRRALRLLSHAQEARIFGIAPESGNTDVQVTLYATPRQLIPPAPGMPVLIYPRPAGTTTSTTTTPAGGAGTTTTTTTTTTPGTSTNLTSLHPFQFVYHVHSKQTFSVSVGLAVSASVKRGATKSLPNGNGQGNYGTFSSYLSQFVSSPPPAVLFVSPQCPEHPHWYCNRRFTPAVGVDFETLGSLISTGSPTVPHVYLGWQFWPVRGLALGAGLSDNLARPVDGSQLGFYFSATADLTTATEILKGAKQVTAH